MFLPALPCFTAADAAALEGPAVPVFEDYVVRRQQMASLAGCQRCLLNRPQKSMMLRVAAGLADAGEQLAGTHVISLRNSPTKLSQKRRGAVRCPVAVGAISDDRPYRDPVPQVSVLGLWQIQLLPLEIDLRLPESVLLTRRGEIVPGDAIWHGAVLRNTATCILHDTCRQFGANCAWMSDSTMIRSFPKSAA